MKRVFDERGIEIPFPHQTVYFGVDKSGRAPAARFALESDQGAGVDTTPPAGSVGVESDDEEPADPTPRTARAHRPEHE